MRRLDEYIQRLDWQSEGHRLWYTHKNPYGCWICEALQNCEQMLSQLVALERTIRTLPKKYSKQLLDYNLDEQDSNNTESD